MKSDLRQLEYHIKACKAQEGELDKTIGENGQKITFDEKLRGVLKNTDSEYEKMCIMLSKLLVICHGKRLYMKRMIELVDEHNELDKYISAPKAAAKKVHDEIIKRRINDTIKKPVEKQNNSGPKVAAKKGVNKIQDEIIKENFNYTIAKPVEKYDKIRKEQQKPIHFSNHGNNTKSSSNRKRSKNNEAYLDKIVGPPSKRTRPQCDGKYSKPLMDHQKNQIVEELLKHPDVYVDYNQLKYIVQELKNSEMQDLLYKFPVILTIVLSLLKRDNV